MIRPTDDMLRARAATCGVDPEEFRTIVEATGQHFRWIARYDRDRWSRVVLVNIQLWLQQHKVAPGVILDIVTN